MYGDGAEAGRSDRPPTGRAGSPLRARPGSRTIGHHQNWKKATRRYGRAFCDQAKSAPLLKDLKQRDMLDDTLVIWGGEFGRTPTVEVVRPSNNTKGNGRDHNHHGFTMWLAGVASRAGTCMAPRTNSAFGGQAEGPRPRPARTILHLSVLTTPG